MTISVFLDPSKLPNRTQEQKAFDDAMAYLMQNLPLFAQQMNATEGGVNAVAAGGVYTLPYMTLLTGNNVGSPGGGYLGLMGSNDAPTPWNLVAVTRLYFDTRNSQGTDVSGVLDNFVANNSSFIKGDFKLTKIGDPTKWLTFGVIGVTAGATNGNPWRVFDVICTGYSSPVPFSTMDSLLVSFTRAGSKGDTILSGYSNMAVLTSSNSAWAVPAGVDTVKITCVGAGSGGNGGRTDMATTSAGGTVGRAANISINVVSGLVGRLLACVVGAGGLGTAPANSATVVNGAAGGASFVSLDGTYVCYASGGAADGTSTGSAGDLPLKGVGQNSPYNPYGSGGDGGRNGTSTSNGTGRTGGSGLIIIEY